MLTLSGATRALAAPRDDDRVRTPEEEREARELTVSFLKRLRETDDFSTVTSDLLPSDFGERIKEFIRSENSDSEFFSPEVSEALLQADASELRRAYIALMNFWNQQDLLYDAAWDHVQVEYQVNGKDAMQEQGSWGQMLKLKEESVPEEAFLIAQTDPVIDGLFDLIRQDCGDGRKKDEADEAKIKADGIHSVERLRAFTNRLERCIPLLRRGVEKLRWETQTLRAVNCIYKTQEEIEKDSAEEFHVHHVEVGTAETEMFGLAQGASFVSARISTYQLVMTRVDGRLKLIAIYPDFDGD
jgi:hypothetical protein